MRDEVGKSKQRQAYYRWKKTGICWKCKRRKIKNAGGALCRKCIEVTRQEKTGEACL